MNPYSRTVRSDLMITMSEPLANPTADVELAMPDGIAVTVSAAMLNAAYRRQQAAYAAEAYADANGVLRGPTGARRRTNRIRLVDVADMVTQSGARNQQAA